MPNIKEIALKAGYSTVPAYWLSDEKPIACSTSNLERLVSFAEALVAELAKENKPVYAFRRKGLDYFCTCDERRYEELAQKPTLFEVKVLYTLPPTAEQIEQETAEACAKTCMGPKGCDGNIFADDAAMYIRSGKWKEYL